MDIKIGIVDTPSVLELELAEDVDRDALKTEVDEKIGKPDLTLWLTDRRGKEVCIPAGKISFVEIGSKEDERRIGFGA